MERKVPSYHTFENGYRIAIGDYRPGVLEESLTYNPDEGDVFIATYPKCGTTWVQYILYLMLNKGVPLEPGQNLYDYCPHLEDNGKKAVENLKKPRIIKTHLPYNLVPKSEKAKYIYITRNPKDCCVSFYHHTKGFSKYYLFEDGTFDDYFEVFLEGKVDSGDYFDHLLSWFHHRNDSNVLFLLYEDMKQNAESSIDKIGKFLGGPFQQAIDDPNVLQSILQNSSLKAMRNLTLWETDRPQDSPFVRKGVVGDWHAQFTEDQSKRLDEKFKNKLNGTGAELLWDKFNCLN